MNNPVNVPELVYGDVNFQAFINCKLTLKNGKQTVLWAFVPKGVSFEDIEMGLNKASKHPEPYTAQKKRFIHYTRINFCRCSVVSVNSFSNKNHSAPW